MRALLATVFLLAGVTPSIGAQEMELPLSVQVPLFVKALTFDRRLRNAGQTPELVVGIAYQGRNRESTRVKDEAMRHLRRADDTDPRLPAMRIVPIDLDATSLDDALRARPVHVLYVTPMRAILIEDITAVTRRLDVRTMTGVPRYVTQGVTLGLRQQGDRPRLLINMNAARMEDADFSAELLKLAQLIQ